MSLNKLVSEGESSSEESAVPTPGATPIGQKKVVRIEANEDQIIKTDNEQPLEGPVKEDQDDQREGTPNIKNEMIKSKITLNQSVLLTRLSPDSNKVIAKLEAQTNVKITIRCVPIASAPELNPKVFKISDHQPFATLIKFIRNKLRKRLPDKNAALHCYINNSFVPSPDEIIGDLYRHFGNNNELVISYSTVVAFG